MATIKDVEVFAIGVHNGRSFDGGDLDEIVRAFNEGKLAGKLPVKLGHSHDDTMPSQGWLMSMRRVGDKIVADVGDVAPALIDEIKAGRWRHVSIELLHDATIGGKKYTWAPDGLAILGAVRPAVQSLEGLHRLVASALPGVTYRERLAFSYSGGDDVAELRATVARQHQTIIRQQIEGAIVSGACSPAARYQFGKAYRLTDDPASWSGVTAEDWASFRATQPRGMTRAEMRPTSLVALDPEQQRHVADPGERIVTLREEFAAKHNLDLSNTLHFDRASAAVAKAHPEIMRDYIASSGQV